MTDKDIHKPKLHTKGAARQREAKDKSNLCSLRITVRKQTAWHLLQMAKSQGHGDPGRIVDKLVRAHQLEMRGDDDRD